MTLALDLPRWRSLHLAAGRVSGDRFLARRVDRRLAGGTEPTGLRDYTTGDDFRYVDWNLCARHDELRSREFHGAADAATYLLLDASASMDFGEPNKFEYARRLAAALAYLAVANLDRVTLLTFADRLVEASPNVRGRRDVPRVLEWLERVQTSAATTHLARSCDDFLRRPQRPGLVLVVSDLLDPAGFGPALDRLMARGYEPYLVHLYAPQEAEPAASGNVQLADAETGGQLRVTLRDEDLVNYRAVFAEFLASVGSYGARRRLRYVQTSTAVPVEAVVERMITTSRSG